MRLERRKDGRARAARLRQELEEILGSDSHGRPVCAPDCPQAGPSRCSRHCPEIPLALSSDPEKHPLEPRIAPLVYELKRLEVFHPCWSCEGHNGPAGTLWKLPRVWLYCDSVAPVRVLAGALHELHLRGRLSVPWRVALTFSESDSADTTFSLEPAVEAPGSSLSALHGDIDTIAEHLHDVVFAEARRLSATVR